MIIKTIVVSPFMTNCYFVGCEKTKKGAIIDPGDEGERIHVLYDGYTITHILLTHGHIDHVAAAPDMKEKTGAPVYLHRSDNPLLANLQQQALMFGMGVVKRVTPDHALQEGEELKVGEIALRVLYTPGHSLGSVSFHSPGGVFSGDALFAGSIGRTDLPGGSYETLIQSIKEKLFPLGDETVVYSGHGPKTTIGEERLYNPFLSGRFHEVDDL